MCKEKLRPSGYVLLSFILLKCVDCYHVDKPAFCMLFCRLTSSAMGWYCGRL